MLISVIFTTYNSPAWLEKVLWGFHAQSDRGFEIVIADDGSGEETKWVIDRFKSETDLEIKHVWQPDDGFRKCKILNKALLAADGKYFVVTDGDCIPRHDFVFEHR
ncbi:MAG: glycosyltransferase, partial [Pseudomonadales bacterium]